MPIANFEISGNFGDVSYTVLTIFNMKTNIFIVINIFKRKYRIKLPIRRAQSSRLPTGNDIKPEDTSSTVLRNWPQQ
jgi:hypothetical protein